MKTEYIRIAIADDHNVFRNGLKNIITEDPGLKVVIEAVDGQDLLEKMARQKVDIALLDLSMPRLDGNKATHIISRDYKHTQVIGLSMHDDIKIIQQLITAGARGYLLKTADPEEIIKAIHHVHQGKPYFSNDVSVELMNELHHMMDPAKSKELTEREKLILRLLYDEKNSAEIANELHLSVKSVDLHKRNLMEKLGVKTTVGLVKYAMQHGLVN